MSSSQLTTYDGLEMIAKFSIREMAICVLVWIGRAVMLGRRLPNSPTGRFVDAAASGRQTPGPGGLSGLLAAWMDITQRFWDLGRTPLVPVRLQAEPCRDARALGLSPVPSAGHVASSSSWRRRPLAPPGMRDPLISWSQSIVSQPSRAAMRGGLRWGLGNL